MYRSFLNEMAVNRRDLYRLITELQNTVFEHTTRVFFFPSSINQNKWRNEICSKYVLINSMLFTQGNKKFKEKEYTPLFDVYASSLKEFQIRVVAMLDKLAEDGLVFGGDLDFSLITEKYFLYKKLRDKITSIFLDKSKIAFKRDDFRKIFDSIVE